MQRRREILGERSRGRSVSQLGGLLGIRLECVHLRAMLEATEKPERVTVVLMEARCMIYPVVFEVVNASTHVYERHSLARGEAFKERRQPRGDLLQAEVLWQKAGTVR